LVSPGPYKRVNSPVASTVANREHHVGRSPVHSDTRYLNIRISKLKVIRDLVKVIEEFVKVIGETVKVIYTSNRIFNSNSYRG